MSAMNPTVQLVLDLVSAGAVLLVIALVVSSFGSLVLGPSRWTPAIAALVGIGVTIIIATLLPTPEGILPTSAVLSGGIAGTAVGAWRLIRTAQPASETD